MRNPRPVLGEPGISTPPDDSTSFINIKLRAIINRIASTLCSVTLYDLGSGNTLFLRRLPAKNETP